MSQSNTFIFKSLHIISWIIFIGLCIEAGGYLVNFFFSLYKPDFIPYLYQKINLTELYAANRGTFFLLYLFILSVAVLKAFLFYLVVMLLYKLDLARPFNPFVARQISRISYYTLAIGFLLYIAKEVSRHALAKQFIPDTIHQYWSDGQAFILMGAVIYAISIIFKKGMELQIENDLTV